MTTTTRAATDPHRCSAAEVELANAGVHLIDAKRFRDRPNAKQSAVWAVEAAARAATTAESSGTDDDWRAAMLATKLALEAMIHASKCPARA